MKTKISIAIIMALLVTVAQAGPPMLVDPQTGKYLGNLSSNQFDPNSVNNPFGRYGSEFSPDSINNQFGEYGSQFSPNSVNNQFATGAPVIVHRYDTGGVGNRSHYNGLNTLRDEAMAIRHRATIGHNPIDELNHNLSEYNQNLAERNRILDNELFWARQEREAVRRDAYIRYFYDRAKAPTDYNHYAPPPMTESDWTEAVKRFPAKTSNTDVTKPATSSKPVALVNFFDPPKPSTGETNTLLEDNKKLDPSVFRGLKTSHTISEIPYWHDIVAKPGFSELPVEEQARLKEIYFNYWIEPHAGEHAASLRQQFMSMKP